MMDTFTPQKPEQFIFAKISAREATLIKKLRKYSHGKFMVQKIGNRIIRLEIQDSQIIEEDEGLELANEN